LSRGDVPNFVTDLLEMISRAYFLVVIVFALAVLLQIAFAGNAALLDPEGWTLHAKWVAIFQWLSIALPVLAFFKRRSWSFLALNFIPVVIVLVQYVSIHYAIRHGTAWIVGLHAAVGAILFGFLIFLLVDRR
jgi:hypothetical protein